MILGLALYALTVSLAYAVLAQYHPMLAAQLTVLFVAMLVVPLEVARRRR